jgi:signal peptidase I
MVGALAAVVVASLGRPYRVPTDSMAPALLPGDVIWVWRTSPAEGDIVLFDGPSGEPLLKRAVRMGPAEVEVAAGLLGDGRRSALLTLDDPRCVPRAYEAHTSPFGVVLREPGIGSVFRNASAVVPEGTTFVLGDNRDHSTDSRAFGPVPEAAVRGVATRVLWSVDPCTHRFRDRWWASLAPRSSEAYNPAGGPR